MATPGAPDKVQRAPAPHATCPVPLPSSPALAALFAPFAPASDAPAELFNGHDFPGWELVASPATETSTVCHYLDAGVLAIDGAPTSFLATTTTHENYRFHVEWRGPGKTGNGGILLHISSGPKDRQWPLSLQVQTKHGAAGDVLPMAGASFAEELDPQSPRTPQRVHLEPSSEHAPGEWNHCDIVCHGDTIEVTVNGVRQNHVTRVSPAAGRIGFQLEGTPFELRNVRISPLDQAGHPGPPTRQPTPALAKRPHSPKVSALCISPISSPVCPHRCRVSKTKMTTMQSAMPS